jgi:hypothetical protein
VVGGRNRAGHLDWCSLFFLPGVIMVNNSLHKSYQLLFSPWRVYAYLIFGFSIFFMLGAPAHAAVPGKTMLTSPAPFTTDRTPTIAWDGVSGASNYEIWVNNLTSGQSEVIHEYNVTSTTFTPSSDLSFDQFRVWVRASNGEGNGPWSNHRDFQILDPANDPPATPVITGPSASSFDTTPTITWLSAAAATYYELWISNLETGVSPLIHETNLPAISSVEESYTSETLAIGPYRVWVRAHNANGASAWSSQYDYTILDPNQPPTGKANITAPPSQTSDRTPTLAWEVVENATQYEVWVNNLTSGESEVIHVFDIGSTSYTPSSNLSYADYRLWVRASNSYGDGPWSNSRDFRVTDGSTSPPATPVLTHPSSITTDTTPTIRWNAASGATSYDLWVNNLTTGASRVIREPSLTETSFTPTSALADGTYRAWIQARNSSGVSSWSAALDFTIIDPNQAPGKANLTAPSNQTADRTPSFIWDAVPLATQYELWVNNKTTGESEVIHVSNITGTSYTPTSSLYYGDYRAWVRASNSFGDGSWSNPHDFTINDGCSSAPSTPSITGPMGVTSDSTPTFNWTSSSGAIYYDLWVNNVTTGQSRVIREQSLTANYFTPSSALPVGTYRAWVQARNMCGESNWSFGHDFMVGVDQDPVQTLLQLESDTDHWVGQGVKDVFTPVDGEFSVRANYNGDSSTGIRIHYEGNDDRYYDLSFDAPYDLLLEAAEYPGATRFPFNEEFEPGLSISTNGRGCNQVQGEFRVLGVTYATDGSFESFGASFTHYCDTDESGPALRGTVWINFSDSLLNYCSARAYNAGFEWIAGVKIGDFENRVNEHVGYEDFTEAVTGQVIALSPGTVEVELEPGFLDFAYAEYWGIWLDVNKDGDFDDPGEQVYASPGMSNQIVTGTITIPETVPGKTRLRVRMYYHAPGPGVCGDTTNGQVEDYTVQVY